MTQIGPLLLPRHHYYEDHFTGDSLDPGFTTQPGDTFVFREGSLWPDNITLERAVSRTGRYVVGIRHHYDPADTLDYLSPFFLNVGSPERLANFDGRGIYLQDDHDSRQIPRNRCFVYDSDASNYDNPEAWLEFIGSDAPPVQVGGAPRYEDHDDAYGPYNFGAELGEIPFALFPEIYLSIEVRDDRVYGGMWTSMPPEDDGEADFVWASCPLLIPPSDEDEGEVVMRLGGFSYAAYYESMGMSGGGSRPEIFYWRSPLPELN